MIRLIIPQLIYLNILFLINSNNRIFNLMSTVSHSNVDWSIFSFTLRLSVIIYLFLLCICEITMEHGIYIVWKSNCLFESETNFFCQCICEKVVHKWRFSTWNFPNFFSWSINQGAETTWFVWIRHGFHWFFRILNDFLDFDGFCRIFWIFIVIFFEQIQRKKFFIILFIVKTD